MKKQIGVLKALLLAGMLVFLTGCGSKEVATSEETEEKETEEVQAAESEETEEVEEEEEEEPRIPKECIVYFANWNLDCKEGDAGGEVASIPWESATIVNHAFWEVYPADGSTETSFERRDREEAPRTEFKIKSTEPKFDIEDKSPSTVDPDMERNHFAEYAVYSEKYPDVDILISFGGWTRCGYFSEMAYTPEGRASFVNSCMELMEEYPWIDGIDIDWEYPAGSNDGERLPEDDNDQGCPIWGTKQEDTANFAALLKELREAMEEKYGAGNKLLTACASASTGWTLPNQDWPAAEPYLDYINVMTYDMAGDWDHATGHASSIKTAKAALAHFLVRKIPNNKIVIGTPMYGTGFRMDGEINPERIVGSAISVPSGIVKDNLTVTKIQEFEAEAVSGYDIVMEDGIPTLGEYWDHSEGGTVKGWHFAYDERSEAAYMYNDDETSEYYKWYISYENPLSLQAKLELIEHYNTPGIIVWESSEDNKEHQMINQIADFLIKDKQ